MTKNKEQTNVGAGTDIDVDRLFAKVDQVTALLYERAKLDSRVSHFFPPQTGELSLRMKRFLGTILSGNALTPSTRLLIRNAHKPLNDKGMLEEHFNIVSAHIKDVAEQVFEDPSVGEHVYQICMQVRDDVLDR